LHSTRSTSSLNERRSVARGLVLNYCTNGVIIQANLKRRCCDYNVCLPLEARIL
jgi:hypothetical protein